MMLRQSFKAFVCIGAICAAMPVLASGPMPPPPPVDVVDQMASCMYARLDIGGAFPERPSVNAAAVGAGGGFGGGGATTALGPAIEDTAFIEGGIGCQVVDNLRVDITGGARLRQSLSDPFDTLDAQLRTFTGFVNVYYDITNYGGWTPYLGGGVGIAVHKFSDVVAPVDASFGTEVSFAWNVQAGLSYDLSPNAKIDMGYRLTDLGTATSGGPIPFEVDDLMAHEFKIGVRYHFGAW